MKHVGPVQKELAARASLVHDLVITFNQWPESEAE
jgi:hypothetical protein